MVPIDWSALGTQLLQAQQSLGTGTNTNNDQGIFQAPPNAKTLPQVVDPRMAIDPNRIPGDYSKLPFEGGIPNWAFGPYQSGNK